MRGAAAILCIVVVAICGLGIKGGAQLADYPAVSFNLKDYPTVSFDLNGAGSGRYRDFIGDLREIVTKGATITRSGATVLRPADEVPDQERFVLVRLTGSVDSATLAVDVVNLYVVAFLANGRAHFFSDATPLQTDNLFVGTQRTTLSYTGSYNDLERQAGATRETIALGRFALDSAISSLGRNNDPTRARSIIVVIQMVSEAVRFRHIEVRIWFALQLNSGRAFFPSRRIQSMENRWSDMSLEIQRSVDGLNFGPNVQLQDEHGNPTFVYNFNDVSRYTMVAVLLYQCRQPTTAAHVDDMIIRMPVLISNQLTNDEPCDLLVEPRRRIRGWDGLCVDLRNGQNNNGNAIQLSQCGRETSQRWTIRRDGTIRSMQKCMTTDGYSSGASVTIFNCSSAVPDTTKWTVSVDGTITNPRSGHVLTAHRAAVGTHLVLWNNIHDARQGWTVGNADEPIVTYIIGMNMMCLQRRLSDLSLDFCANNTDHQKWALYSDGTIRPHRNRRLCVASRSGDLRAAIFAVECNGLATQRWVFNNTDFTILNPNSKLVMDVSLGDIILFRPNGNPSQQWLTHTNPFG